jgi:hypothetical protein
MKTLRLIGLLFLAAMICFSLAGCSSPNLNPFKALVAETNVVENVTITPAQVATVTNGADVVTTLIPESYQTNYVTNIVYSVNPPTASIISTVRGMNNTLNPTPTAPFVEVGLGLLTVGLAAFARFKTKQAQQKGDLLNTVIAGVEAANNPDVKAEISKVAALLKKNKELDQAVQEQTR